MSLKFNKIVEQINEPRKKVVVEVKVNCENCGATKREFLNCSFCGDSRQGKITTEVKNAK